MKERLRVLVLARSYPNDAIETLGLWTESLTLELSKYCEIQIVSPVPYCPPLPQLTFLSPYTRFRSVPKNELRSGLRVHHPRFATGLGGSLHYFEPAAYYYGVRGEIRRLRSTFPFDLIHAHFTYPEGVVASRLAEQYEVPLILTEHAPWLPLLDDLVIRRQALRAALKASSLIAVSKSVAETMSPFLQDRCDVRVIPNGVDGMMFKLPGEDEQRNLNQVLYVGQINFNKGIDNLLASVPTVIAANPNATFLLAGGSYYRSGALQEQRLRKQTVQLGISDHVQFVGPLPQRDVAALMRRSGLLVLPSLKETFGVPLIEALASGTPVVATRSGGPQEIVTPEAGVLVPPADAGALAAAIVRGLASSYDREHLRDYVLRRFGWPAVTRQYLDEYKRAKASGARGALSSGRTVEIAS